MKKPPCSPSPVEQDPLQKAGFRNNDEWEELLARANQQIQTLEGLEEGEIKDTVFSLLNDLDAIHREALTRLVALFKDGVLEQVVTDPAIHTLMEIYGLAGDFPEPGEMTTGPVPADNVSPIPVADN
ncbi:MAG: hypothetical protein HOF84_17705, partial [Rhodospirillales bacterium]|nr:hypothetical protein [Rhodospirillales bacterium]